MLERFSTKEKILSLAALLMIVIAAGVWTTKAIKGSKNKMPALPSVPFLQENPIAAMLAPSPNLKEKMRAQKSKLRQSWGRDPFSKLDIDNVPSPSQTLDWNAFVLTGIIQRGTKRVAILNRLFVHEGDDIQGIQVVRIDQDKVILKKGEEEAMIKMGVA